MKNAFFICILFVSILFSCSKDDNEDPEKSYIKINGTEYKLNQGALMYYGNFEGLGVYNHTILLLSPEIKVNWSAEEASGIGAILNLEFFNTQTELAEGTYTFSTSEESQTEKVCDGVDRNGDGLVNDQDCLRKLPSGKSYISLDISFYGNNVNVQDEYYETSPTFKSGTVTIQIEGNIYKITFDCVGANNDKIEGVYQGVLTFLDYSEN